MHDPLLTACTLASVLGALAGPDGKQGGEQLSGVCSRRLHGTTFNTSEKKRHGARDVLCSRIAPRHMPVQMLRCFIGRQNQHLLYN